MSKKSSVKTITKLSDYSFDTSKYIVVETNVRRNSSTGRLEDVKNIQGGGEVQILDISVQAEIKYQELIIDEKQEEIENARDILTRAISDQNLAKLLLGYLRDRQEEVDSVNKEHNSVSKFDLALSAMLNTKPNAHKKKGKRV